MVFCTFRVNGNQNIHKKRYRKEIGIQPSNFYLFTLIYPFMINCIIYAALYNYILL